MSSGSVLYYDVDGARVYEGRDATETSAKMKNRGSMSNAKVQQEQHCGAWFGGHALSGVLAYMVAGCVQVSKAEEPAAISAVDPVVATVVVTVDDYSLMGVDWTEGRCSVLKTDTGRPEIEFETPGIVGWPAKDFLFRRARGRGRINIYGPLVDSVPLPEFQTLPFEVGRRGSQVRLGARCGHMCCGPAAHLATRYRPTIG